MVCPRGSGVWDLTGDNVTCYDYFDYHKTRATNRERARQEYAKNPSLINKIRLEYQDQLSKRPRPHSDSSSPHKFLVNFIITAAIITTARAASNWCTCTNESGDVSTVRLSNADALKTYSTNADKRLLGLFRSRGTKHGYTNIDVDDICSVHYIPPGEEGPPEGNATIINSPIIDNIIINLREEVEKERPAEYREWLSKNHDKYKNWTPRKEEHETAIRINPIRDHYNTGEDQPRRKKIKPRRMNGGIFHHEDQGLSDHAQTTTSDIEITSIEVPNPHDNMGSYSTTEEVHDSEQEEPIQAMTHVVNGRKVLIIISGDRVDVIEHPGNRSKMRTTAQETHTGSSTQEGTRTHLPANETTIIIHDSDQHMQVGTKEHPIHQPSQHTTSGGGTMSEHATDTWTTLGGHISLGFNAG
nr:ORF1 [Ailanthus flavi-like virus]